MLNIQLAEISTKVIISEKVPFFPKQIQDDDGDVKGVGRLAWQPS